ncbi:MAG: hypothetical protein JWM35_578 [Verrucomicrobia bacterium]|nr:hypothetical protein [Verrucomicrobiota bacterium]
MLESSLMGRETHATFTALPRTMSTQRYHGSPDP